MKCTSCQLVGIGNFNDYELNWSTIVALETQLLGISRPELLESTAQVLKNMGRKRAIVVTGPEGLDEAVGQPKIALLLKMAKSAVKLLRRFEMERYAIERCVEAMLRKEMQKFCSAFFKMKPSHSERQFK